MNEDSSRKNVPVQEPVAAGVLMVIGWLSVIGGALCFIAGFSDSSAAQFSIGVSAVTGGFLLIGFSSGLGLLTNIANSLAQMVSRDEPTKRNPIKEMVRAPAAIPK